MRKFSSKQSNLFIFISLSFMFLFALTRVYLRVETTMVGYELGSLKNKESEFLEERSLLKMELARLTTKKNLTMLAGSKNKKKKIGSYARQ